MKNEKSAPALGVFPGLIPGAFSAGTSSADITPTWKEIDEYGHKRYSSDAPLLPEGVASPLMAKALATRCGDQTLLLITGDIAMTSLWSSDTVRVQISEKCHIPREAIAICTSQTHSAIYNPDQDHSPWNQRVVQLMVDIGVQAIANLRPAKIGAATGCNTAVVYNSRLPITDDVPLSVCPDRERHRGGCMFAREHVLGRSGGRPVDHEVGVIRIDGADGKPMAVVYHYSCHPATVIEGPSIHGDLTGFASAKIEETCPGATALFLQGSLACAHPRYFFTDVERARENGLDLANEVLRVLPDIKTTGEVCMNFVSEPFAMTFMPFPRERLLRLLGYFKDFLQELDRNPQASWMGAGADTINFAPRLTTVGRRNQVKVLIAYCEERLAATENGRVETLKPIDGEIQTFVWNDIALCLHNWEMFFQTGFEIKRLSPARYTFPVGNTNSLVGYVPPQDEFDLGGYEVVTNPMFAKHPGLRSPENTVRIIQRFMAQLDSAYKL